MDLCHVSRTELVEANLLPRKEEVRLSGQRIPRLRNGWNTVHFARPALRREVVRVAREEGLLALLSPPPRQCRSAENFGSLFRRDVCPPGLTAFEPALATALLTALPS